MNISIFHSPAGKPINLSSHPKTPTIGIMSQAHFQGGDTNQSGDLSHIFDYTWKPWLSLGFYLQKKGPFPIKQGLFGVTGIYTPPPPHEN